VNEMKSITVEKEGRYWNVVEHFDNGGSAWQTFPDPASARKAADILIQKGPEYHQGGKEAGLIRQKAWDDAEPVLARLHARHARTFLSRIPAQLPASKLESLRPEIKQMRKSISNVESQAKLGSKNAEQTRKAQADLFDAQFKIEKHMKDIEMK
jgi:hypothetical protein